MTDNFNIDQLGERYANFYTDFAFKKYFGTEANKDLLISFLNALLQGQEDIVDIKYLPTEHLSSAVEDRRAIFDIYCENKNGDKFIIEMQKTEQDYFKDRAVYYASFPIREFAPRGEWNYELKRVYCIGILNFKFDDENTDVKTVVKLMDTKKKTVFYDKLTFIFLEMPNFKKALDELENMYEKWLFAIKNLNKLLERPAELSEKVFLKLFETAEIAKFSPAERRDYEESMKNFRDLYASLETKYNKGVKDGFEKGREEAEARAHRKDLQSAMNLYSLGVLSIEQIAQSMNLDVNELNEFIKTNSTKA